MGRGSIGIAALVAALLTASCAQATPPTPPTQAPAAAPKPAEPTKAPAAAASAVQPTAVPKAASPPTAAPAKAVDFPAKGKSITIIVMAPAGGGVDIVARMLAAGLEKQFGAPVQVANKGAAGGQEGVTEFARSKPDGYTILGLGVPSVNGLYLNPERQAVFSRKDFVPLVTHVLDPAGIAVKADSPHKTLKDLIDAAKARPDKVTMSANGILTGTHLGLLQFQQLTSTSFAGVMIPGDAPALTALLGGQVDASFAWSGPPVPSAKAGQVRMLAMADKERSPFYPDVPTMPELGINLNCVTARGYALPGGTPKEIVDILASASQKIIEDPSNKKKVEDTGSVVKFMGPAEFAAYWDSVDAMYGPIIKDFSAQKK